MKPDDEMRDEYDFSNAKRSRYAERYRQGVTFRINGSGVIFRLVQACHSYRLTRAYLEVRIRLGVIKRLLKR